MTDRIGEGSDAVTLRLGGEFVAGAPAHGDDIKVYQDYDVQIGIFNQPGSFSLSVGWGDTVRDFLEKYPPNTLFELRIGGQIQLLGRTDGYVVNQNAGATTVHIRGRDLMAPLIDGYVTATTPLVRVSFQKLAEFAIQNSSNDIQGVLVDNTPNRQAQTGSRATPLGVPVSPDALIREAGSGKQGKSVAQARAKISERWIEFLNRELGHAGLFVWASATGQLVLSRPNVDQAPLYTIYRERGTKPLVNVLDVTFQNEATHRFSSCKIYGRRDQKAGGTAKPIGEAPDLEMQNVFKINRLLALQDTSVADAQGAGFLAVRKLAAARRRGFRLQYTVSGHSTVPRVGYGASLVWARDTIVQVYDNELGLSGPFYIENVQFKAPPCTTTLTLLRADDVRYALEGD